MSTRFAGFISGTSADGIDGIVLQFDDAGAMQTLAAATCPYPLGLRARIEALIAEPVAPLQDIAELDAAIGDAFADAALRLFRDAGIEAGSVSAIGSHGQTVFHHPGHSTLQLGDANRVARQTGVPVVADLRRADMAASGQGAPLAPLFHRAAFGTPGAERVVVNLGGIANVTVLRADGGLLGFDTGPANTLLDGWAKRHGHGPQDTAGAFAAAGNVDDALLERLLDDPYFSAPPPKSTGRERFHMHWLDMRLMGTRCDPAVVQATLLALTVVTVSRALATHAAGIGQVYLCGGGVHNAHLVARLANALSPASVMTTADLGVHPDFVEAALCAWLARERIHARSPAGLGAVTGADAPAVLGGVYLPPR